MTSEQIIEKAKKALSSNLRFYFSHDMIDENDGDFANLFEKYNKQLWKGQAKEEDIMAILKLENFIKDFEQTVERRRPDYIQGQAEDYVEDHLPG